MKWKSSILTVFVCLLSLTVFAQKSTKKKVSPEATAIYKEIQDTLGIIPTFFAEYPEHALAGAWEEFKVVQLAPSSLSSKHRELISLGVSAQIPCKYCIYFHTEMAKAKGATDAELEEALAMAASVRKLSTYMYGTQVNFENFKSDILRMVAATSESEDRGPASKPTAKKINNAEDVYEDVKKQFGFVPEFIKLYPKDAVVGAWKNFKSLEMEEKALPPKVKSLINLATASQIPCVYCVFADTEFAKANGATSDEIRLAVLAAAQTRNWSTIINGIQMDEKQLKKEVEQILKHTGKTKKVVSKITAP